MPPPTMTTSARSGSGPEGAGRGGGGRTGRGTPWSSGRLDGSRVASVPNVTGCTGGRGVKGTISAGVAPRRRSSWTTAFWQLFPWQGPVPNPVYRFTDSRSRWPRAKARRTSERVTSSQAHRTVLPKGGLPGAAAPGGGQGCAHRPRHLARGEQPRHRRGPVLPDARREGRDGGVPVDADPQRAKEVGSGRRRLPLRDRVAGHLDAALQAKPLHPEP